MDKNIMMYDEMLYRGYTQKSEYDKALSTLIGISKGIVIDKVVEKAEIEELINWISVHSYLEKFQPFSELIPIIRGILEDGIIDESELEDLAWICSQFEPEGKYYELNRTPLLNQEYFIIYSICKHTSITLIYSLIH